MKVAESDFVIDMYCFVSLGRKNPKSEWWNYEVKSAVEKKEASWIHVNKE